MGLTTVDGTGIATTLDVDRRRLAEGSRREFDDDRG